MKGLSVGEMIRDVGILGALVACFLIGLFFKDQLGGILGFFTEQSVLHVDDVGLPLAGRSRSGCCCVVGVKTNFSIGSMLLFVLFIAHLLVGAVELGTDGWIQNITGNILTPAQGKILFVFTSLLMFSLRFCADFIERHLKISPIGLLLICSLLAMVGLRLVSGIDTFGGAMMALARLRRRQDVLLADDAGGGRGSVPAHRRGGDVDHGRHRHDVGRPARRPGTRLREGSLHRRASERRPRRPIYETYKAPTPSKFLFLEEVHGLDGTKLSQAQTARRRRRRSSRPWSRPASSAIARR